MKVLAIILALSTGGTESYTCRKVQSLVAAIGAERAEQYAKDLGMSQATIDKLRQCIPKKK